MRDEILKLARECGADCWDDTQQFNIGTLAIFYRAAFNAGVEAAEYKVRQYWNPHNQLTQEQKEHNMMVEDMIRSVISARMMKQK